MAETDGINETASKHIEELIRSATQREWQQITRALEVSKEDAVSQQEYMLPALAWLQEKRAHGGCDWNRVLDMTDEQIIALLGLSDPAGQPSEPTPAPVVEQPPVPPVPVMPA